MPRETETALALALRSNDVTVQMQLTTAFALCLAQYVEGIVPDTRVAVFVDEIVVERSAAERGCVR
jgi:hypothetical protein